MRPGDHRQWKRWSTDVQLQPWYRYRAGLLGFCLVYASLGAWLALLVR